MELSDTASDDSYDYGDEPNKTKVVYCITSTNVCIQWTLEYYIYIIYKSPSKLLKSFQIQNKSFLIFNQN